MEVLCATKQKRYIRNLSRCDLRKIEKLADEGRAHLVYYIYDHVNKYGHDSVAKGLFVGDTLVGVGITADYDNVCEYEIPLKWKNVDRQALEIIEAIAVGKQYEGKGYGSMLIKELTKEAKERGKMLLYADMSNKGLIKFYKNNGFYNVTRLLVVREL